jgi:effector-binding domain-containing protein
MIKILKVVGYTVLGILILLVALAVILPKEYSFTVEKPISTSPNYIYNVLIDPNIKGWNHLEFIDTTATFEYLDKVGIGAGFSWENEKGKSKMRIQETQKNTSLINHVYFYGEEVPKVTTYTLKEKNDATNVEVEWQGSFSFPGNLMGLLVKRKVRSRVEAELLRLEKRVYQRANDGIYRGFLVSPINVPEQIFLSNRGEVKEENVEAFYTQNMSSLYQILQEASIQSTGSDCALIYDWNDELKEVDLAAAIPIGEDVSLPEANTVVLPQASAVKVDYYGSRRQSRLAHQAIKEYLSDRGLFAQVPAVEEYVTDVLEEKDPNKWLSKITYRIVE